MNREEKKAFVATFKHTVADASVLLLAHYSGLSVAKMDALRRSAASEGVRVKIAKNRLVRLALEGTAFAEMIPLLKGPVVALFGNDPVSCAKVSWNFAKTEERLKILGAFTDGALLRFDAVKILAELPSLDTLRGKLVGLFSAPAQQLAAIAGAPAAQLARVFNAYAQKG